MTYFNVIISWHFIRVIRANMHICCIETQRCYDSTLSFTDCLLEFPLWWHWHLNILEFLHFRYCLEKYVHIWKMSLWNSAAGVIVLNYHKPMEMTLNNFSTKSQIYQFTVWHLRKCAACSLICDVLCGASFITGVVCLPVCVPSHTRLISSWLLLWRRDIFFFFV